MLSPILTSQWFCYLGTNLYGRTMLMSWVPLSANLLGILSLSLYWVKKPTVYCLSGGMRFCFSLPGATLFPLAKLILATPKAKWLCSLLMVPNPIRRDSPSTTT